MSDDREHVIKMVKEKIAKKIFSVYNISASRSTKGLRRIEEKNEIRENNLSNNYLNKWKKEFKEKCF